MPRSTKDSEEEVDPKPGRKTRLTDAVSVDSPLRRSSRIKSVKQNESSPESLSSDTSNVSNTQTRITRRRTGTMDNTTVTEKQKSLRSRMNSVSSDVSEVTENDANTMTPTKRNRNSVMGDMLNKTNIRRSTRFTRAGSESKTSPIRITRNTRATSMEPESATENKHMNRNERDFVRTPSRMRRRTSIVPSEATVVEEKEENMKVLVVALDRTLPNVSETKEMNSNDSLKPAQKHDSMSNAEDNLDSSCHTVNKESTENISEKSPSKSSEDVEKDTSTNDNNTIPDNDKNKSEESEDLLAHTVTETESAVHNLSQSFSQKADQDTSKELGLKIENLLSNSMEKHEDFSNKENLAANVISDEPNIENTDSNTPLQSPKPLSVSNSNKLVKEICKSPCNLSSRSRHSRSTESMDDSIVNVKEVDSDVANDSVVKIRNTEDSVASKNMPKLDAETDSLSEPTLNTSSDKYLPLKISSDLSSCESLELVQCMNDVTTTDDEKLAETSTTLNKETIEVRNDESNETVNDATVSNVEKTTNANKESEKDNIKSDTSMNDQDDVNEKVNKPDTSGNVQNDDGISCANTCSSLNLTNTVPLAPPDNTAAANTEHSPILKNKETSALKNINKTNTSFSNTNSTKSINADEDSGTDVVKSSSPSTVTETPNKFAEEVPREEESANDSLTLKNKSTEKSESDKQKSESTQETCNKNQENVAVEDNDSDITATDLFQDIPAAEWKEKNADADTNSIHSMSTDRLEHEMEAECDLVLVDKEAWLAAENMKAAKEKEAFDYDSDDTVLLKMQRDSVEAQKNEKAKMNKSVDKMNVSKDSTTNENDVDNKAKNTKDFKDETENENQDKSITEKRREHSTAKHNVSSRKSFERKSLNESHKTTEVEENLSESITKKRKSLNKSTSKADVSRKSLNKSNQKEKETSESELNSENVISTSVRKDKEKRSLNISSKKQRNCIEESDNESKESSISEKKSNVEKKFSRKRSAVRTIESDSDDSKSDSGDSRNKTIELPKFMLDEASDTDSNESDKSMDSDIEKEYNLGGKDISKFSDDDVLGDECRASETESSDPEDNGSDLEDFIVDYVEENEESEEEEKVNEDIEIEELHTDEDIEENQEKEIEEQDEAMQVQEPDAIEDQIKKGTTEEPQNENEQENIEDADKLIDTSSKQKSKLEISDHLSTSQTSKKKKLKKVDTSQSEKENSLSDLSLSNSLKMKTPKQKKRASGEFIVEDIELPLKNSQPIFNKRNQKLSKSMVCSTPESHRLSKSDEFDVSIKTLNASDDKINASLDKEKIKDTNLKTKDNLKKLGKIKSKENLVDKRLSYGLQELVEKTKFSKPLSSEIANLNKTHSVPDSDTPTTKYLKKDKLNESAPVLKLDTKFKKLVDANGNDEQNNALNQFREESEDVNTPNSETLPELDTSLKQKVLSVADNILEVDRRKKHKKRKQAEEKSNTTILIEDTFLEDTDLQIVSEDNNVVFTIDNDENKTGEEASLNEEKKKKKKKRKQKITHIDINKDVEEEEEVLYEEITDTKSEITKKPKKIKKKQVKEITENLPDICSGNQVSGKKKKKISEALLNEEITTRISKKKQKLSTDVAVQDDETTVEKLPKKKKKLMSEDTSSQEKVPTKKLLKKKQNLSSNDTSQDINISAEKLSKKQHKLVEKGTKSEVKPVKKSNKSQQSTNIVQDSDEGPTVAKFSKTQEEALKAIKCTTDSIKVNKEKKKKKQQERMQEVELENKNLKLKKQKVKDNKIESTKGIKRLSDEFLENLSDVPLKPLKKRKLSKIKDQILPSRTMFDSQTNEVENIYVKEYFEPLSSCGSTTQFAVINIQKMKKKKKIPVISFKQKMIARNSRQPVSAYLMYLEKQNVAGKDKFFNEPY